MFRSIIYFSLINLLLIFIFLYIYIFTSYFEKKTFIYNFDYSDEYIELNNTIFDMYKIKLDFYYFLRLYNEKKIFTDDLFHEGLAFVPSSEELKPKYDPHKLSQKSTITKSEIKILNQKLDTNEKNRDILLSKNSELLKLYEFDIVNWLNTKSDQIDINLKYETQLANIESQINIYVSELKKMNQDVDEYTNAKRQHHVDLKNDQKVYDFKTNRQVRYSFLNNKYFFELTSYNSEVENILKDQVYNINQQYLKLYYGYIDHIYANISNELEKNIKDLNFLSEKNTTIYKFAEINNTKYVSVTKFDITNLIAKQRKVIAQLKLKNIYFYNIFNKFKNSNTIKNTNFLVYNFDSITNKKDFPISIIFLFIGIQLIIIIFNFQIYKNKNYFI